EGCESSATQRMQLFTRIENDVEAQWCPVLDDVVAFVMACHRSRSRKRLRRAPRGWTALTALRRLLAKGRSLRHTTGMRSGGPPGHGELPQGHRPLSPVRPCLGLVAVTLLAGT